MPAPTFTVLVEGGSTVDSTKFVTSTHTPTANRTMVLGVLHFLQSTDENPTPTIEGNGCTWVADKAVFRQTQAGRGMWLNTYRAQPSAPVTGNTTIALTASTIKAQQILWSLIEMAGAGSSSTDGAGALVQGATVSTNSSRTTVNLAPFAATSNVALGFFAVANATPNSTGAGFAVLSSRGLAEGMSLLVEYATNTTAVISSRANPDHTVAIAYEIREAQGVLDSSANFDLTIDMSGGATFAGMHALFDLTIDMAYSVLRGVKTGQGLTSGTLRLKADDFYTIASKLYNSSSPNVAFYQDVGTARAEIPLTQYSNAKYVVLVPASTNTAPLRLAPSITGSEGIPLSSRGFSVFSIPENSTGNMAIYTTSSGSTSKVRVLAL